MADVSDLGSVSSPAATGGAGTFFEQHVDAYWLALLLVRGIPPILHDCGLVEVHFQTERLGWNTDDFLVVGDNGSGLRRKLLGQVKRNFNVSATNEECKKAIQDFWKDFLNREQFTQAADRFTLVTLRGTNTLLEHFSGLLDCSRAARDAVEFEARLATPGFLSAKAVHYCGEIRTIVGECEGKSVTAAEVWPFLRVLHVLSLDLNSATRQTEAMIKTLLAHTARDQDAMAAAEASWNALLREIGEGMPESRSFSRDDLPEAFRQRHSPVGSPEERALRALSGHSMLILAGIRATIGTDLHLSRGRLVQEVIGKMESAQVVLVTGPAGSGKSGIAKDAIGILAADHFAFSFRAEEFARPHFDETLQSNQIPASAAMFGAIFAGQGRKVMLVDSVERLLEASTRDAFTDLLTLVSRDKSWRVILTCRNYSADLVRTCFLEAARVGHAVLTVPFLDDGELREVEASYPTLAHPLANAPLRRLLRNPYVLDKAVQIAWSEDCPLPQSERDFRALFWREVVRVDHRPAGGMPRRREAAFVQIALRRARALSLYANCPDLDAEVIAGLQRDSLIVSSRDSRAVVAPAHDVLEDWAILQWIDEQWATHDGSAGELSAVLGTHPAVRRTYRKWASELVERASATADRLFQAIVREAGLPAQFRDDTLVSLLRSPSSAAFLERHRAELLANDKQLLRRVIHLLRVACVTTPAWLEPTGAHASLFNVPDGPAWACVLRLVETHLASFAASDRPLLLGFIEDWARGVSWATPYPEGADSVAAVAHWLMPQFDDHRSEKDRKRTMQVIAKIPNADRDRFAALLGGLPDDDDDRHRVSSDFRAMILEGLEGMPAARDMPEALVSAAGDFLLCSEADLRREWGYGGSLELEPLFGIKCGRNHGFFPASAYRGPFLPLLRNHPREGLAFTFRVFNHVADWYAHPRVRSEYVEPPFEITLTYSDGSSQTQWCNARLWNLYRGTSVGPYALQCLLMALERWLLELAEQNPSVLDAVLTHILRGSNCASLTAVAASVATTFPHSSGETLLVLLGSPPCILLDKQRSVNESQAASKLAGLLLRLDNRNRVYEQERREADGHAHRNSDLETAIVNLQLGAFRGRVHDVLDQHRTAMPPVEEQDEDHRVWRLALHRMDLRQYVATEVPGEAPSLSHDITTPEAPRHCIRLDLKEPEPDVKEMADESAARFHAMNARLGLLMWGIKLFRREEAATYDPAQWQQRLQEARRRHAEQHGHTGRQHLGRGGPALVAAVCVRDYWEDMSTDEQNWCVNAVCAEVERYADNWDHLERVQIGGLEGDRACASVLPLLLGRPLPQTTYDRARQVLAIAMTHAIDEVRNYAAWGIGKHLWGIDRNLTLRCVNAIAMEARLVQQSVADERDRLRTQQEFAVLHGGRWVDSVEADAAHVVRERFLQEDGISHDAVREFDTAEWFGSEANVRILTILGLQPTEPTAVVAFEQLAHTLVQWWDADSDRRRGARDDRAERSDKVQPALTDLLQEFLMHTSAQTATTVLHPILDALDRHPRETHWLLLGLIGIEDRERNTPQFWALWQLFADRVRHATWLRGIDRRYADGHDMISAIFLGSGWKEEVRHWRSLEGFAARVDDLFQVLPASSTVLGQYLRFLYQIGEQSLPQAFSRIAARLPQEDHQRMLGQGDSVFLLEVLLRRYVYGKPLEMKRERNLREAVLFLLDVLVENGSSVAFRMRDDFVTPVSGS